MISRTSSSSSGDASSSSGVDAGDSSRSGSSLSAEGS